MFDKVHSLVGLVKPMPLRDASEDPSATQENQDSFRWFMVLWTAGIAILALILSWAVINPSFGPNVDGGAQTVAIWTLGLVAATALGLGAWVASR